MATLKCLPGGETPEQFYNRVLLGVNKALEMNGPVLIVAHQGIFKALCHFTEIENFKLGNCSIVQFTPSNNNWHITLLS